MVHGLPSGAPRYALLLAAHHKPPLMPMHSSLHNMRLCARYDMGAVHFAAHLLFRCTFMFG